MASDCKVKNLQSLKREIRALLISSKHGCTPKRLEDDYLKVMGESIPYHFLGHTNFMSFIYSIPDVVSVCRSRNNIVLYGVADDATKKIQSLVSRQKSKTRHLSFTSHPRMNQVTKTTNPAPREPAVPLMFKTYLKELMLSHPNGIALNLFNEAFAKRYHHYIAFRNWGFETLESMVRAVPDVLWVHDDTTRNIKMVKRVLPQNKVDLVTKDSQGRGIDWYSLGKERRHSISEGTEKQGEKNGATVKSVGNGRHEQVKAPLQPKKRDAGVSSSLHSLELSPQMKKKVLDDIRRPLPAPEVKKSVPKDVSSKIKALLQANQSGIWVSRFLMEFRGHFQEDLNLKALGFSCVVHLLHTLPCCAVEKPGSAGDWLVYLKGTMPPKVGANHKYHSSAYVSEELTRAVHKMLKGHKKGIPLSEFAKQFKMVTDYDLPLIEMGFSSTAELLQRVPGIEMVRPPNTNSMMVFSTWCSADKEKEADKKPLDSAQSAIPSMETFHEAQPSVYKLLPLPTPSNTKFQAVYVTEVRTPSSISVQLIGKETTQVLECLQEDMAVFYRSTEGKSYTIEETSPGQACCAPFNNDGFWYRAEVQQIVCVDIVKIRFVDYGNVTELPLTSIRRPKLSYLTLPAQAVECRLCHLKPAGSTWSLRANQLLKQMTKDIPLVAVVTAVENRLLSMYLVDTSTSRDVFINDALANQGLALFEADTSADMLGEESYNLEIPLHDGDGKTLPDLRMPKDPYVPPSAVPRPLLSQQVFFSQLHNNHASQQQATPLQQHPQQATPLQQHPQQVTPLQQHPQQQAMSLQQHPQQQATFLQQHPQQQATSLQQHPQQATPLQQHPRQATPLQQHPQQATPINPPGMPQPTLLHQKTTLLHPPGMPHPISGPAQHATPLHPPGISQQRPMGPMQLRPMMGAFPPTQQLPQYYPWQQQNPVYPTNLLQTPLHSSWQHRQPSEHTGHAPISGALRDGAHETPFSQPNSWRPPVPTTPYRGGAQAQFTLYQGGAQAPTDMMFRFSAHHTPTPASKTSPGHTPCPAKATAIQNGVGGGDFTTATQNGVGGGDFTTATQNGGGGGDFTTATQNGVGGGDFTTAMQNGTGGGGVQCDGVEDGGGDVGVRESDEGSVKWSVVEPSTDDLLKDISTPPSSSDSTPLSSDSEEDPPLLSDCTLEQLMMKKKLILEKLSDLSASAEDSQGLLQQLTSVLNLVHSRSTADSASVDRPRSRAADSASIGEPAKCSTSVCEPDDSASVCEPDDSASVCEPDDSASVCEPDDSASVCEPDDSASVCEPDDSASVWEPDDSASVCEPDDSASVCKPDDSASVCEPDDSASVCEPDDSESVCEPDDSASVCEPDDSTSVCKPDDSTSVFKTDDSASVSEPDDSASVSEPDDSASVSEPDDSASVSEPDDSASMSEPDDSASVCEPDDSESVCKPDDSASVAEPDDSESVCEPDDSASVCEPDDSASVCEPDDSASVCEPDDSASVCEPDDSTIVCEPDDSASVCKPDDSASVAEPDDSASVCKPDDSASVAEPDDSASVCEPDDSASVCEPDDSASVCEPDDSASVCKPDDSTIVCEPDDSASVCKPDDSASVAEPDDSASVAEPDDSESVCEPDDSASVCEPDDSASVCEPDESASVCEPDESASVCEPDESASVCEPDDSASVCEPDDSASVSKLYDSAQDRVESQDTAQDHVESQDTVQDHVESQDTAQDRVESQETARDRVESQDTAWDHVESQDAAQNRVKSQDTSQDCVESQDSGQDHVKLAGSIASSCFNSTFTAHTSLVQSSLPSGHTPLPGGHTPLLGGHTSLPTPSSAVTTPTYSSTVLLASSTPRSCLARPRRATLSARGRGQGGRRKPIGIGRGLSGPRINLKIEEILPGEQQDPGTASRHMHLL